jgi:hypothetical protein
MTEATRLSFSKLDVYNDCGEKYRLKYVERVAGEPSGFFIGGVSVHRTLQQIQTQDLWDPREEFDRHVFEGEEPRPGRVFDLYQSNVDKAVEEAVSRSNGEPIYWGGRQHGETEEWWRRMGPVMLRRAAEARDAWIAGGWTVVQGGSEIRVGATLPSGQYVTGFVDYWIAEDETGEGVLVDWSTGRVGGKDPFQLATYAWAIMEATKASGKVIYVARGLAVYLRASKPEKMFEHFDLTDAIPSVPDDYAMLARGIEAGIFRPNYGFLCGSCGVRKSCHRWLAFHPEDRKEATNGDDVQEG